MKTPIALAIIIAAAVSGSAYFGITQYQNYQREKAETERQIKELTEAQQEKERQPEEENGQQGSDLADLKKELEALSDRKPEVVTQPLPAPIPPSPTPTPPPNSPPPSPATPPATPPTPAVADLAKFIVMVICSDGATSIPNEAQITIGSGTVFGLNKFVITNLHVVAGAVLCSVGITDNIRQAPSRWYEAEIASKLPSLDIALLEPSPQALPDNVSTVAYNLCPSDEINLGDEIIVLGYPGVGGNTITATEGVISGFEGFMLKTSAKIEHGNSGGGAFLKKSGCWFGIPTAVAQGELESLGRIINYSLIHQKTYE